MKVVANIDPLLSPLTGIGHYTQQLLIQLLKSGVLSDLRGASVLRWYDKAEVEMLLQSTSGSADTEGRVSKKIKARAGTPKWVRRLPYARTVKRAIVNRVAKKNAEKVQGYVYWEPNYTLLPLDNPSIVTVHDLSHKHYPQYHPAERVSILESTLAKSIDSASRIIAVSEYTKKDIALSFEVPSDKIAVVPPAVSGSFRCTRPSNEREYVRNKYQLPEHFILSVATLEPRKNITGLINAFISLPQSLRKRYPLVLVGAAGWSNAVLEKQLAPHVLRGEIYRLGYVEQSHLPCIYTLATCMAYISFFEGYGMPVAEAMASGLPVITSNTSSMPEVANGAAILVDPYDIENISEALRAILEDKCLRERLSIEGREKSKSYTWSRSSEQLLTELNRVAQENR